MSEPVISVRPDPIADLQEFAEALQVIGALAPQHAIESEPTEDGNAWIVTVSWRSSRFSDTWTYSSILAIAPGDVVKLLNHVIARLQEREGRPDPS